MARARARVERVDVAIVGGGISGLTTAFRLREQRPDLNVVVLDAAPSAGGAATTTQLDGFEFDRGANGFLTNVDSTWRLAHRLGLGGELVEATDSSNARYIYRNGALHQLPMTPGAMLGSPLFSTRDVLRLFAEPLVPAKTDDNEESVYDFVGRRFGYGVARALAPAFVTGIVSGDASRISVGALFARLPAMERDHGSIIRAMMANGKRKKAARRRGEVVLSGRLTSFRSGGMGTITARLSERLGDALRHNVTVDAIKAARPGAAERWELTMGPTRLRARAVVLAVPAAVASRLTHKLDRTLSDELGATTAAHIRVLGLGWRSAPTEGHPMDGFGFLVPRGQGVRMLGSLWSSSVFPNQAPAGGAHMRVMYGGMFDPDIMDLSEDRFVDLAMAELRHTMGIASTPDVTIDIPWPSTVPQYEPGHLARLQRIDGRLASHPRLFLTGNAYRGVGINDCVREAERVADHIVAGW